jgi:hypothetical protein
MERIAQYEQMIRDIQADPDIKDKARFIAFLQRIIEEERAANSGSNFRRFLGGLRERNQSSTSRSQTRRSTSRRHKSRASNGSTRRRNRNGSR